MNALSLGDFLTACGDAGADCINGGVQFDDALRARVDAKRAQEAQAAQAATPKQDVDRLVAQMGMSNFRTK